MRKSLKDNRHFYLVENASGSTYLVATSPSATFSASLINRKTGEQDEEVRRHRLNITPAEHRDLAEKSITHTLKFDTLQKKVITIPKPKPKTGTSKN